MEYISVIVAFVFSFLLVSIILFLNKLLGPKPKRTKEKEYAFECGVVPLVNGPYNPRVRFYLIAILFVLFDVEAVFLFPWAILMQTLGWSGFFIMLSFLMILWIGLFYAYRRGALDWS